MDAKGNYSDEGKPSEEGVLRLSEYFIIIYTFICYCGICQILNIFGIITNIINIFCFVKQGFQDSVNISLLGLAASDLGSLTTMTCTCVFITLIAVSTDLTIDPVEVAYLSSAMLHFSFIRVSGCLTALITMERCLCITIPLQVKSIITPQKTTIVMVCVFIIFFFSGAPVYAVNRLGMKFYPTKNKTLVGLISTADREHVEKITFTINNFSIQFTSFVIVAICTTILSVKLRSATKWRLKTTISTDVDKFSSRSKKTAKMVVMISTLFIVCFLPMCFTVLMLAFFPEMFVHGKHYQVSLLLSGVGYVAESINSSANIFVYYHMSTKYREVFSKYFARQ